MPSSNFAKLSLRTLLCVVFPSLKEDEKLQLNCRPHGCSRNVIPNKRLLCLLVDSLLQDSIQCDLRLHLNDKYGDASN
uniref:Uncharacterized protein n=1 Tax=Salix viminalis TaxID=40686 RepID=A0A6N2LW16_SALVM